MSQSMLESFLGTVFTHKLEARKREEQLRSEVGFCKVGICTLERLPGLSS